MTNRLIGAYWQLRNGGEMAIIEYQRSLSELAGKYGRNRIEGLVEKIIKQCGDMPAICDMPKFVPPVGEFKRCAKCQPDGWIFEEVPGKKLPVARRCKHEAA